MQTFRQLLERKTRDTDFKALYEQECNVCLYTVRIFEKLETQGIDLKRLAAEMKMDKAELQALKEADCCDPRMVIALCRHLNLDGPPACPKLNGR
jgi:hypothetical protein